MTEKKTVRDVDVHGQTVLLRVDFNVPFVPGTTEISDDSRIRASLPTLKYLLERQCKVVVCSHLGRPNGQVVESLRMVPVSLRLASLLGAPVAHCPDTVGKAAQDAAASLAPGEALMLENTRFHVGEEKNDAAFANELASLAALYVNDAFGAAHRAHASTEGVAHLLPSAAGLLMEQELRFLGGALENPRSPFAAVLGGAKVSDKIGVLHNLKSRVDLLLVGGDMAATFIKALRRDTGASPTEKKELTFAIDLIEQAERGEVNLLLPKDVVVAAEFAADADAPVVPIDAIPTGFMVMDIGPQTALQYSAALAECKTVMWNGPMGVFEWEAYSHGTRKIAKTLASLDDATTVLGGGSTAEAVAKIGLSDRMTHISSGGGASLEFMEGKELPGIAALPDRV